MDNLKKFQVISIGNFTCHTPCNRSIDNFYYQYFEFQGIFYSWLCRLSYQFREQWSRSVKIKKKTKWLTLTKFLFEVGIISTLLIEVIAITDNYSCNANGNANSGFWNHRHFVKYLFQQSIKFNETTLHGLERAETRCKGSAAKKDTDLRSGGTLKVRFRKYSNCWPPLMAAVVFYVIEVGDSSHPFKNSRHHIRTLFTRDGVS